MKKHLQIIAVLLLTVMVYLPALKADFMYDDRFFVQENAKIREWRFVPEYFVNSSHSIASIFWDGIWRPLRTLTYLVDYKIWGLRPLGFHLTSLLWHLANITLLYFLLGLLFKNNRLSLTACLIFALHPVQTETVTWISSRGDLMYAGFGLLTMWLYFQSTASGRTSRYLLSLASFILALLSKETAVVVPALMVLHDWLFVFGCRFRGIWSAWRRYLPYLLVIAAYLVLRSLALGRVSQCPYWGDSFWTTAFTMFRAALEYLRLLFLPLWLRVDYVYDLSASLFDWRVLGSLAALGGISWLAWRDAARTRFLAFGWLWLFIGLLPVSNLLPLTAIMAERFLYLPLAGFAVWVGNAGSGIRDRRLFLAVLTALALPMSWLTARRNLEWRTPESFWTIEVGRSPGSYVARGNLGNILLQRGDLEGAEREYLRAVELDSTYDNALSGLAIVCAQSGRMWEAEHWAGNCLRYNPRSAGAMLTIGICLAGRGLADSAQAWFARATRADPGNDKGWANLGAICRQKGEWDRSVAAYQRAVRINPGDFALYGGLGTALAGRGDIVAAREAWRRALDLNPHYLEARMNLAVSLEPDAPGLAAGEWEAFLKSAEANGEPVNEPFIRRRIAELNEKDSK